VANRCGPGTGSKISINLIPTPCKTALGQLPGLEVNLEIDLIARYVERMLKDTPTYTHSSIAPATTD
jgi:riboflavin synthase